MLPPTVPTEPPTEPVSESCVERDSRGTANVPAKSDGPGRPMDWTPRRELLTAPGAIHEWSPAPQRLFSGEGANGITFGGVTLGLAPNVSFCPAGSTLSG